MPSNQISELSQLLSAANRTPLGQKYDTGKLPYELFLWW